MFLWALEVAKSALFAQQTSIYVTSHNIANVNTPEYSRQQVVLSTLGPVSLPVGYLGRGVWVEEVRRIYDRFLSLQINSQQSEKTYWETYHTTLSFLEGILGSSEQKGLGTLMDEFFNAWHDLSLNPQGYAERTALLAVSDNLVKFINYRAKQLSSVKSDINQEIDTVIQDVNRIISEIARINGLLRRGRNDLFDERDGLLRELAQYLDFTVLEDSQGRVSVLVGGIPLVEGLETRQLEMEETQEGVKVYLTDSGVRFEITSFISSGKLGALLRVRNQIYGEITLNLDELARRIIYEVNRFHSEGEGLSRYSSVEGVYAVTDPDSPLQQAGLPFEVPQGSFFVRIYDANGTLIQSGSISVDPSSDSLNDLVDRINNAFTGYLQARVEEGKLIIEAQGTYSFSFARGDRDPSGILAALGINVFFVGEDASTMGINPLLRDSPEYIATSSLPSSPGDNSNALQIAELQTRQVTFQRAGASGQTVTTFKDFYASIIGDIGLKTKDAMNRFETAEGLLQSLENRHQEISGVSMDEEVINLMRLQRSYEAATKIIGIVDELLETLIALR